MESLSIKKVNIEPINIKLDEPFGGGPAFTDPVYRLKDDLPGIGLFRK